MDKGSMKSSFKQFIPLFLSKILFKFMVENDRFITAGQKFDEKLFYAVHTLILTNGGNSISKTLGFHIQKSIQVQGQNRRSYHGLDKVSRKSSSKQSIPLSWQIGGTEFRHHFWSPSSSCLKSTDLSRLDKVSMRSPPKQSKPLF